MFCFAATALVNEVLRCSLVILTILVIDDSNKHRPSPKEPPFNADKSCKILKTALESFGATVITVKNESLELLHAILEELKTRAAPDSCQLLWFVFSGHGCGNNFCIKDELMGVEDLICQASEINISRQMFFFECCLVGSSGVKVANVNKQHMVLYSAPPNKRSYHWNGVGLMVSTLAKLLEEKHASWSLNDLHLLVRQMMLDDLVAKNGISQEKRKDYENEHIPVCISMMTENINLYDEIQEASKLTTAYTSKSIVTPVSDEV